MQLGTAFARLFAINLVLLAILVLASCRQAECAYYEPIIQEDAECAELVGWADREVFSRHFAEDMFWVGGLSGPGRLGALKVERAGIQVPERLGGLELRLFGASRDHADGLFLGHKSWRGVFIARTSLAEAIDLSGLDADEVQVRGRVALICYRGR